MGLQILPDPQRREVVKELTDVGGLLNGNKIKLFVNDYHPARQTVLADLVEATFDGYAASSVVVWGAEFSQADGTAVTFGDKKEFVCTGPTVAETVYGYWLETPAVVGPPAVPATLRLVQRLDAPIPINGVGSGVIIDPVFSFGQ